MNSLRELRNKGQHWTVAPLDGTKGSGRWATIKGTHKTDHRAEATQSLRQGSNKFLSTGESRKRLRELQRKDGGNELHSL